MIVFLWLTARRMPAGARGVDTEAQFSSKANWISHNYTHLMEQPTVFYPVVIVLALMGDNSALSANLAWGYAGVRALQSNLASECEYDFGALCPVCTFKPVLDYPRCKGREAGSLRIAGRELAPLFRSLDPTIQILGRIDIG